MNRLAPDRRLPVSSGHRRLATLACMVGPVVLGAPSVFAQTVRGTVVEENGIPVRGVAVAFVDAEGNRRGEALSDSLGRFTLSPPGTGEYRVEATGLGYEPTISPLFAFTDEGFVEFEIVVNPRPIGLEGFEVSVEPLAVDLLVPFGLSPNDLGRRWIDNRDIERMPLPPGPREAIRWRGIPGVVVHESPPRDAPLLCIEFRRGPRNCALIYLNGIRIGEVTAQSINPADLRAIAILTPIEATTFLGTGGARGAVMMWTK